MRLRRLFSTIGATVLVLCALSLPLALPQPVFAQANEQAVCEGSGGTFSGGQCTTPDGRTVIGTIKQVANILIFIVGAVAVLMIIIGGLRYVLSAGDQNSLTAAKNTILYSVVGLVVAVASYAIVNFVLDNIGSAM